jgi:galactofuranosylgalactofuranosylrhamnosyl-N-acetylglucosaminyl-diphospho-decaprenol beta-1,5/1,6-galactofuranosyltransferase
VALRAHATRDALAGPEALPGWLATRVVTVRAEMASLMDAASRRPPAGTGVAVVVAAAATVARHVRLLLGWPRLAARFRAAADEATSVATWQRVIEEAT